MHVVVLTVIFIAAVFGFARYVNQTAPNTGAGDGNSTFPLVYMQNNGVNYNCLHGYAREMDVSYIRDTVTVLNSDHELAIQIEPFDTNIESISYEVLTQDGAQSLENTTVLNTTEENNNIGAVLTIQTNVLLEQEYILKIKLTAGGRDIYYYTRLSAGGRAAPRLVSGLCDRFLRKMCEPDPIRNRLGTVVEPDETTGTSRTLAEMDIHDSVTQLMWGELYPQIYYKPTPSLVDINGTTASFVLDYRISAADEEGVTQIYNVSEFYRLRYTDTRVFSA